MDIRPIASGSSGNAYWISDGKTPLLLDAGIPMKAIQIGCGFRVRELGGCFITHCHGDHSKAAKDLLRYGVDVYTGQGTAEACRLEGHRLHITRPLEQLTVGTFLVLPFDVEHDAPDSQGFLLESTATGEKLLYFTDTYYLKYRFSGITHILGECNYTRERVQENLAEDTLPTVRAARLMHSHMSLQHLVEFLEASDLSRLKQIYLVHLSAENSDEAEMKRRIQRLTGAGSVRLLISTMEDDMAGVKIEQGTLTHRKTLRLKGLLGIGVAQAVGHLTMLWVWAASSTKDGSLAGMTPTEIAEVSGWAGEPADFLAAMIDAGYIDEAPDGFRLHDWAENTGQIEAEARREAARERQRRFKERKRAEKAAETARTETSKVLAPQQKPLVVAPQPPQRTEPRTDPELARAGQFYLNNINPTPPRWELEDLTQAVAEFGADVVIHAMEIAQRNKAPNWKYTRGVLARYREKDVKDLAATVDADKWTKEEARNGKAGRYDRQRDAVPATQDLAGFHTA